MSETKETVAQLIERANKELAKSVALRASLSGPTGYVIVKKTRIYRGGKGETGVIYPTPEAALPALIEWTTISVNWHRGFETVPYKAES